LDAISGEPNEDKARHEGSLGWKTRGSLIKASEDAEYALGVYSSIQKVSGYFLSDEYNFTAYRPFYVNPAVKTGEEAPSAVSSCAARFMLTPCFQVKYL